MTNQSGAILFRLPRGFVRRFQKTLVENNLDCLHMSTPLHSILHIRFRFRIWLHALFALESCLEFDPLTQTDPIGPVPAGPGNTYSAAAQGGQEWKRMGKELR